MRLLDRVHSGYVHTRRVRVLSELLAKRIPPGASVLDIGCGDGLLGAAILGRRPELSIEGIDVLVRPQTHVPVRAFDGRRIPYDDGSVDVSLLIDVLHHTNEPSVLLSEAARVSRRCVLIKDHLADGFLARPTLRFMDDLSNRRFGVALPHNYLGAAEWRATFERLRLEVADWSADVPLYPFWASWAFGRRLHFVATLWPRVAAERLQVAERGGNR